MLVKQDTHNTIFKVVSNNRQLHQSNLLYSHLFHTYMSYILISLRRQLKVDNRSISLRRLLLDISDNISELSSASTGRDDIEGEIQQLLQVSRSIEDYVDKRIAHADKREVKAFPSPTEIDECIRLLKSLHKKYHSILKGENVELMPAIYDWTDIFRIQWIQDKSNHHTQRT